MDYFVIALGGGCGLICVNRKHRLNRFDVMSIIQSRAKNIRP